MQIRRLDPKLELESFLDVLHQGVPLRTGAAAWRALELREAGTFRRHLVGELNGRIVAAASITDNPLLADGVSIRLTVDSGQRGRGLGRAMAAAVQEVLASRRPRVAGVRVLDDDATSRAWAERRGLVVEDHSIRSRLVPEDFDYERHRTRVARALAEGFVFEKPLDDERLYELYVRLIQDVPDHVDPPSREFLARQLIQPGAANLIVRDGGTWAGLNLMIPAPPDGGWTVFTGVLPEHRGRGLATALKAIAIRLAFRPPDGLRWIETSNNATNAPILALNRALGFRRLAGTLFLRKRLRDD